MNNIKRTKRNLKDYSIRSEEKSTRSQRPKKKNASQKLDESIFSCLIIIFSFVLFRFKFILFKYYFLLDLFYFNCIFIFQERIFDRFSFGAKERGLGADSGWKIRDSAQKYVTPQVRSLARPVPNLTRLCHISGFSFVVFCFMYKLPISLVLT